MTHRCLASPKETRIQIIRYRNGHYSTVNENIKKKICEKRIKKKRRRKCRKKYRRHPRGMDLGKRFWNGHVSRMVTKSITNNGTKKTWPNKRYLKRAKGQFPSNVRKKSIRRYRLTDDWRSRGRCRLEPESSLIC